MTLTNPEHRHAFNTLRAFARKRPPAERCELCGAEVASEHPHLLEPMNRQILCCCDPCAILFSGQTRARFRRIPQRIETLSDFHLTDSQWDSLYLPINLVFFVRSTPAERVVAMFPSPAGAMESLLTLETWQAIADENPVILDVEPDVEAILINRVGQKREAYRVPIDECFKLVGLLRTHWRGLAGGSEVWQAIDSFFASLQERSHAPGAGANAHV